MDLDVESGLGPMESRSSGDSAVEATVETLRASLRTAQARIRELESLVDDEARSRSELVHLVSHELRTPITVITGFARLLRDEVQGSLNEQQHRFVDESLKACRRLDEFVGDLLEARCGSEHLFGVEPIPTDLHALVTAQLEALEPLLAERGMKVETSLATGLEPLLIDPRRITQVVSNLMTNAIRYGRSGGLIRLASRVGHGPDPTGQVEVSVEDDGPGIPEADRERLFAPYVRGARARAEGEPSGLGIGLAICRRVIEAHGGRIRVESSELGGARFVFSLPRAVGVEGED